MTSRVLLIPLILLLALSRSGSEGLPRQHQSATAFPHRVIGYYAVPIEAFPRVASAGFNVVHNYRFESHWQPAAEPFVQSARQYLDAAAQHGLQVMLGIPRNWLRDGHEDVIRQAIRQLRDHPAILSWYEDEMGQEGDVSAVQLLDRIVQQEDPDRGFILEEGTDLLPLRTMGKVRMFTYYPVNHKHRRRGRLRTVGERFPVGNLNVPFMPALQTFGRDLIQGYPKKDLEAPTWPELQFTLYSSLMAGAEGFFLYTYLHSTRYDVKLKQRGKWPYVQALELPEVSPDMWKSAQLCVKEMKTLFDLLDEAEPAVQVRLATGIRGFDVRSWQTPRGTLILLSNATYESRPVELVGLSEGRIVQRLWHDRWGTGVVVEDSTFVVTMPGPGGVALLVHSEAGTGSAAAPKL